MKNGNRIYLKVKLCSLADEARTIKRMEAKKESHREGLHLHRVGIVRYESRLTHLAYGFLGGRDYLTIENKAYELPDWARVKKMVSEYGLQPYPRDWTGPRESKADEDARLKVWIDEASIAILANRKELHSKYVPFSRQNRAIEREKAKAALV